MDYTATGKFYLQRVYVNEKDIFIFNDVTAERILIAVMEVYILTSTKCNTCTTWDNATG